MLLNTGSNVWLQNNSFNNYGSWNPNELESFRTVGEYLIFDVKNLSTLSVNGKKYGPFVCVFTPAVLAPGNKEYFPNVTGLNPSNYKTFW